MVHPEGCVTGVCSTTIIGPPKVGSKLPESAVHAYSGRSDTCARSALHHRYRFQQAAVANRAEGQRFWGIEKQAKIEKNLKWNAIQRQCKARVPRHSFLDLLLPLLCAFLLSAFMRVTFTVLLACSDLRSITCIFLTLLTHARTHARTLVCFKGGPGFFANANRNIVMSSTSFVLTPILYQKYATTLSRACPIHFVFVLARGP